MASNQVLGMTQQPIIQQPLQQGILPASVPVNNMDQIAGVGFMNSQEYSMVTDPALGMTQQPIIQQPQQQAVHPATVPVNTMDQTSWWANLTRPGSTATVNNSDQIAAVGFVNSQEYSTPVPSIGNQGYNQLYTTPTPTPSLVNNSGTGYAGVQYQPQQAYQAVHYVPNAGQVQTQSVFHF